MSKAGKRRLVLGVAAALLIAGTVTAGPELAPRKIDFQAFTCRELLSLGSEQQDRIMIYLSGLMDGRHNVTVFDEAAKGALVERALETCRANPADGLLRVFASLWR